MWMHGAACRQCGREVHAFPCATLGRVAPCLQVTGTTSVAGLTTSGAASLASLSVTGASELAGLTTSGTASLASLSVTGDTTLGKVRAESAKRFGMRCTAVLSRLLV